MKGVGCQVGDEASGAADPLIKADGVALGADAEIALAEGFEDWRRILSLGLLGELDGGCCGLVWGDVCDCELAQGLGEVSGLTGFADDETTAEDDAADGDVTGDGGTEGAIGPSDVDATAG